MAKKRVKKESKEEKSERLQEENSSKKRENSENSTLRNILLIGGVMILLVIGLYVYTQNSGKYSYKNIEFEKNLIGNITFYETLTLANNSKGEEFGFRLRTDPNEFKQIPFENVDNLRIMKLNVIASEENYTFNCGYGVLPVANLNRLFLEMGAEFAKDENATCDPEGRYNYFTLKYGDENSIKEIGNRCYDLVIKGNDTKCDILPVTEKLMVELYSRYLDL
ncbi:MAG: hypothetical protein NUV46_01095 [Nanoarchaeota archaeon]|nr:hypothetical protein [Nanoarchaeota archaeon]